MRLVMTAAALAALAAPSTAQQMRPVPAVAASPADGKTVTDAVRAAVLANYVVAEARPALDAALAKGLAGGRYSGIEPAELARRISEDMLAVANDKHLGLSHNPRLAAELAARGQGPGADDNGYFAAFARARNHGVTSMKLLPGNIRYVAYDGFMWTGPESAAAIDTAMRFLKGGDAAIIDIRANGGGSPDAVNHLTSYFVPAGTKLVTFHLRSEAPSDSISREIPQADRISGMPVYVLTSGRSASAAEEFASHVAGLGFGTLVGETTAGAAYRNELLPIPGGFVLSVSIGRPELPGGRGNWEAKGVAPALAAPVDLALERAQQDAFVKLAAKAGDPRRRAELEWHGATLAAKLNPVAPALPLASYVGRFGPRVISVEGQRLRFQRDGGMSSLLSPIAPDLFALEADPDTRIRFVAEGGQVTSIELQRIDGTKIRTPRG